MPIYALGDSVPNIHPDAYIHPDAVIIGDVTIGAHSSVWPCAVLRGDDGSIIVGERTSIQDGCVIHTTAHDFTRIGSDCTIGHIVHLEGCTIQDRALVGNASVVLHRVIVSTGSIVAANSVLLNDSFVPPGAIAVGAPAVMKEGRAKPELIAMSAAIYVEKSKVFRSQLRRIDA